MSKKIVRTFVLEHTNAKPVLIRSIVEGQKPDGDGTSLEQLVKAFAFTPSSETRVVLYLDPGEYDGEYSPSAGPLKMAQEWVEDADSKARLAKLYRGGLKHGGGGGKIASFKSAGTFAGQLDTTVDGATVAVVLNVPTKLLSPFDAEVPSDNGQMIKNIAEIISHDHFMGAINTVAFKSQSIPNVADHTDESQVDAAGAKLNPKKTVRGYISKSVRLDAITEYDAKHGEGKAKQANDDAMSASEKALASKTQEAITTVSDQIVDYFQTNSFPIKNESKVAATSAVRKFATDAIASANTTEPKLTITRDQLIVEAIKTGLIPNKEKISVLLGITQAPAYTGVGTKPVKNRNKSSPDATSVSSERIAKPEPAPAKPEPVAEPDADPEFKNKEAAARKLGFRRVKSFGSVLLHAEDMIKDKTEDEVDTLISALIHAKHNRAEAPE